MSKFWKSASIFPLIPLSICKIQPGKFPFSPEDPLCPLAFRPIFLLDPVFSLFYTLPIKKQVLIKEFDVARFEQAIQCFQEILVRFPKTEAAPEAQYYLGVAKYKASHDPKELKVGLEVLQRDYPSSEWTKKAQVYALIP